MGGDQDKQGEGPEEFEEGLVARRQGEEAVEEAQAIEDGDGGVEGAREYAEGGEDEGELGEAGVGLAKRKGLGEQQKKSTIQEWHLSDDEN